MDDLELVRLCILAMDLGCYEVPNNLPEHTIRLNGSSSPGNEYWPLTKDAQAMALVRRFKLSVGFNGGWGCVKNDERGMLLSGMFHYEDLNRAICECVASMTKAKQ